MARHPRPALTVDIVVFGFDERDRTLDVLLIKRKNDPFKGFFALPGGFVEEEESLSQAAIRELKEETGLRVSYLEQLYTFGQPKRDPRGWSVTVAYFGLVRSQNHLVTAGDDAAEACWRDAHATLGEMPLAFDHSIILLAAHERLRNKIRYSPIGFDLLPDTFTIAQLLALYQAILGPEHEIDKRNFYRKALALGVLEDVGETTGPGKPSRLYRFDRKAYERLTKRGINFEI